MRCLIVDDTGTFLVAARELLERQGLDVVGTASTIADALELARHLQPDLTLVDVGLGEESGFDLVRRLAAAGDGGHVVLISTYAERDLEDLISASQAIGFVSKSELSLAALDALIAAASARRGR